MVDEGSLREQHEEVMDLLEVDGCGIRWRLGNTIKGPGIELA